MDLYEKITTLALTRFNISAIKPYQLLVVYRIAEQDELERKDVRDQVVIFPTGMGKSLCFLLPAIMCKGLTVIVYPLLALMNDQKRKLDESGIRSVVIRGGQSPDERKRIYESLDGTSIVLTNPETLSQKSVLDEISRHEISLFVCDEAHVIAKWGENFRPSYLLLTEILERLKPRQILAFTATATQQTVTTIREVLKLKDPVLVRADADRPNISYSTFLCQNRTLGTVEILKMCQKPALVFCKTRIGAEKTAAEVQRVLGSSTCRFYHAGLTKAEKTALEDWFLKSCDGILVCTSAYGMGVDKPDIRTVIHHDLSSDVEQYLQESGRLGRDSKPSRAWVVLTDSQISKENRTELEMIFSSSECRRKQLLQAMGQSLTYCSGCDVCDGYRMDGPFEMSILRRFFLCYPMRFTLKQSIEVLCALDDDYEKNPFYGVFSDLDPKLLEASVRSMIPSQLSKLFSRLHLRLFR